MKSKKVKEFIEGHIQLRLLSFTAADIDYCAAMAEEDMADKAAKAFCAVHCPKGCPFGNTEECGAIRGFKQKLM